MNRRPGHLITKAPVIPGGPSPTASAPGIWTLPEVFNWNKQGRWPSASADPYWSYVSFLLGTTATNAAQNNTFLDSSANNFTITRNGNVTQGSATPYGSLWSNYFDGSGDYLTAPTNSAFAFGTGDFTVEMWVNPSISDGTVRAIFDGRTGTIGSAGGIGIYAVSGAIRVDTNIAGVLSGGSAPANVWSHVAVTRASGTLRLFVNGSLAATSTTSYNLTDGNCSIGSYNGTQYYTGYISNIRLVKGTAVYTSAFTPFAVPLTAISGTSLLTCQSNRFRDASSNGFAITRNGDVKVTPFSPFVLAPPGYSTASNSGSGYFDGNDYLSIPNSTAFQFGTGDFTIECWVNKTVAANGSILDARSIGGAEPWAFYIDGSNFPYFYDGTVYTSSIATTLNAWNHIAVVRTSGVLKIFVNGVQGYSAAYTASLDATGVLRIGGTAAYTTGYISNLRIVKGTAIYTAAFTPPTAPVTAVSGTSFLCNFANAGIFDASMNNDTETVGNAQVSSAQAKYGTTSAYFDGAGDYLSLPNNPVLGFSAENFTVETWFYAPSTVSTTQQIVGSWDTGGTLSWCMFVTATNKVGFGFTTTGTYSPALEVVSTATFSTGAWNHLALVRNGSAFNLYLNGTSVANLTNSSAVYSYPQATKVGGNLNSQWFNGYLDDMRITKGYARYTANFTPPTTALPVY